MPTPAARLPSHDGAQLSLADVLEGAVDPQTGEPILGANDPLRCARPCELRLWLRCTACGLRARRATACERMCAGCPRRRDARAAAIVRVLPHVPLRHWTFAPNPEAQAALRDDPALVRWLARRFVAEIFARLYGKRAPEGAGAVSIVHWTAQAIEPELHLHAIALDGAFVRVRGQPSFQATAPEIDDRVTIAVARAVARALRHRLATDAERGRAPPRERIEGLVRAPVSEPRAPAAAASADGARVRVTSSIAASDRAARVRLVRYLTRPWLEPERIAIDASGEAVVTLARPRRDGVAALRLSPKKLVERIRAAVPPSHSHPIVFHGVLAPRAAWRRDVIPGQLPLLPAIRIEKGRRQRQSLQCPRCNGPMTVEHVALALDDLSPVGAC